MGRGIPELSTFRYFLSHRTTRTNIEQHRTNQDIFAVKFDYFSIRFLLYQNLSEGCVQPISKTSQKSAILNEIFNSLLPNKIKMTFFLA